MKKNLTELVFILDRSGSMSGLESDTIGGFNGMLEKQKKEDGEAVITTVLFDDHYELLHDRIDIRGVSPMSDKEYYVRGCTALLDAVGQTINKISTVQKNTSEEMQAEKIIFVIITDGLENASKEYSYNQIKEMVEGHNKMTGWEFMFLGANMDAVSEAGKFGIDSSRAVTYNNDTRGVELNYKAVADAVSMMRCCSAPIGREWKEEIEKDVRKRRNNTPKKKIFTRKQ